MHILFNLHYRQNTYNIIFFKQTKMKIIVLEILYTDPDIIIYVHMFILFADLIYVCICIHIFIHMDIEVDSDGLYLLHLLGSFFSFTKIAHVYLYIFFYCKDKLYSIFCLILYVSSALFHKTCMEPQIC